MSSRRNSWWELRSEEHTSELQSRPHLVCRLLLEKKNNLHIVTLALLVSVNVTATPDVYTLSLHDALPISCRRLSGARGPGTSSGRRSGPSPSGSGSRCPRPGGRSCRAGP